MAALYMNYIIHYKVIFYKWFEWNVFSNFCFQIVAPSRIYALLINTANNIRNTETPLKQVKSLFSSTDYILTQLFPIHSTTKNNAALKQSSVRPFNALKFFTLSTYHKRPLILEIIRDEVNLKKTSLQKFRSEQAASLGVLLLKPPQFNMEQQGEFVSTMTNQTKSCIEMIKYVMDPPKGEKIKSKQKNVHHLQQHLDSLSDLHTSSTSAITKELYDVVKNGSVVYDRNLRCIQSSYGVPSAMTRYWIPAVMSYFIGDWTLRYVFKRKEDIIHGLEELGETAHDFVLNWIWEPVRKVYETIRLKDQRLSLLSKQGLQSDLDVSLVVTGISMVSY